MKRLQVCITFDVDLSDYTSGGAGIEELDFLFSTALGGFHQTPRWRATWFVRLDAQLEALYGCADYIFKRYDGELGQLRERGHELGWHPHSYVKVGAQWKQNTTTVAVVDELNKYVPLAQAYGLKSVRMGWGFHTNETMAFLAAAGFAIDSSAIPRPKYQWEESEKDWEPTPHDPYFPSCADYRVPGEPRLSILEVPMSVAQIKAPYDQEPIIRYLNLAYHPELLREPMAGWLAHHAQMVTITHPYELMARDTPHGLLAFDFEAMEQNLAALEELAAEQETELSFVTLSELAAAPSGVKDHA